MRMKKKLALLLAVVMLLSISLACAPKVPDSQKETGTEDSKQGSTPDKGKDTLVVLSAGAFAGGWDPTSHSILANKHLEHVLYTKILYPTDSGELVPGLCYEWETHDDGSATMKIREGVTFHDGSVCDAEDVKYTIENYSEKSKPSASNFREQLKCDIIDPYTVKVYPSSGEPFAEMMALLAGTPVFSSERTSEQYTNEGPMGTGPYKFVKFENECVYLEAYDGYWDTEKAPSIKYVEYKYVPDAATRLAALQSGEAHIIERIEIEHIDLIEKDANCNYVEVVSGECQMLICKWPREIMKNDNLRLALAYALDREGAVDAILGGHASVAKGFVAPSFVAYADAKGLPTYNPEKAKEKLAEAGYPNGEGLPPITFTTSVGMYAKTKECGEYFVQNWKDVGINVTFNPVETATWEELLYSDEERAGEIVHTGWSPSMPDAGVPINAHYANRGRCNFVEDPELTALIQKQSRVTDPEERLKVWSEEVYPYLASKCYNIPLWVSHHLYGYSANIEGFVLDSLSFCNFNEISFK